MSTQTSDELVVSLTSFARGHRVVREEQRLSVDDAIVTANPTLFAPKRMPDADRQGLSNRLKHAVRPERELSRKEKKRNDEILAAREAKRTQGSGTLRWF